MSSKHMKFGEVWERFNLLAVASDEVRHEAYREDGMDFLKLLQTETMFNYDDPDINSQEDFSEFIVTLRANYKDWNQYLMRLMAGFDDNALQASESLRNFIATCHWVHLVEAARNFMDSRP